MAAKLSFNTNAITWGLKGIATYIPGCQKLYKLALRGTSEDIGGTLSARYCYSIWLRHLTLAHKNGLSTEPDVVAEIGPGNSLGTGLAALISGASKYYAFDVVKSATNKRNLDVLDELVDLFLRREPIPDEPFGGYHLRPRLESYEFPEHILTDQRLGETLKPDRIEAIRNALLNLERGGRGSNHADIQISYFVPWYDSNVIKEASVDLVYSQYVLEHIDELAHAYEALYRWLKPGGFMSHQIDYHCHGTAKDWNGHWGYSDFAWKLIRGKRPYLLNRRPHVTHINFMHQFNFKVVCDMKTKNTSGIQRKHLAPRFKEISREDLTTASSFVQARKPLYTTAT